jgi:hypothetical protein
LTAYALLLGSEKEGSVESTIKPKYRLSRDDDRFFPIDQEAERLEEVNNRIDVRFQPNLRLVQNQNII